MQNEMGGMAMASQKQFLGRPREITEPQRALINELTAEAYIIDDDRNDIELFMHRFPNLPKSYIPVRRIGEGK
jgi:hypothetical protein